jgi:hypothetical protein
VVFGLLLRLNSLRFCDIEWLTGVKKDICGKESFKCGKIAFLRRDDEGVQETSLLARTHRFATPIADVLARARDELSRVRFGRLNGVGDLIVGIIERFAQNIRGAFGW